MWSLLLCLPLVNAFSIPLNRRFELANPGGQANVSAIVASLRRAEACVFSPSWFIWSHSGCSKVAQGFAAFEQNTGSPHPSAPRRRRPVKRRTGKEPLTDSDQGELWFGSIEIGSPGQKFTVDIDTGKSRPRVTSLVSNSTPRQHRSVHTLQLVQLQQLQGPSQASQPLSYPTPLLTQAQVQPCQEATPFPPVGLQLLTVSSQFHIQEAQQEILSLLR